MKRSLFITTILLPLLLTGCDYDEFDGRFISPDGNVSYEFKPDGMVEINQGEEKITADYQYDSGDKRIQLSANQTLPSEFLIVKDENLLKSDETILNRGLDQAMLADTTWIGEQDPYVFSLTFTPTENGLETASELVTYDESDNTYITQTDDSITRLTGNMLLLDLTRYTVSDVQRDSFKITIGDNSMVLEKHPKNTDITIRDGYKLLGN